MQLLIQDAALAAYAFYRESTDEVMLAPAGVGLDIQISEHMKQGFVMVAVVALMDREGCALIEHEETPGASVENVQKVTSVFRDDLIERGIIKPDIALES
jgi:hypothetical protein